MDALKADYAPDVMLRGKELETDIYTKACMKQALEELSLAVINAVIEERDERDTD